ncbi:MAG: hypothetical protein JWN32_1602 [Solirubrobacterales bacterium]|nr:hypothetical protein [Solirubrobacterales bacterium]
MSPRNRRAAATALVGMLAAGAPLGATTAAASSSDNPIDPQNTATTPATTPMPPATDDLAGGAQCGQVIFTNTLPTVITCGPVTITFNTITTTTTITTVAAPITAANGSITTGVATPPAVTSRRCPPTRVKRLGTTRAKRGAAIGARKSTTLVLETPRGTRTLRFRLLVMRHPSH